MIFIFLYISQAHIIYTIIIIIIIIWILFFIFY